MSEVRMKGRGPIDRIPAGFLFAAPATAAGAVFFALPMILALWMSLNNWPLFGAIRFAGIDNFLRAAGDATFRYSIGFALAFAVLATFATALIGLGLALTVQRPRRGIGFLRSALLLPVAIGMPTAAFIWIWLLNPDAGILPRLLEVVGFSKDSLYFLASRETAGLTVGVVTVWKSAGFAMIVYLVGLQSIPTDLREAAATDGASPWQVFRHVTLPLLRPSTALVIVLLATQNFLAFEQFYLLTRGGPSNSTITPVYWIYSAGFTRFQLGYAAALAIVVTVLLVAFNAIQLRVLRRSPS